MEKRQLPDGPNACQRIYLIGRLRKAVKWAMLFAQLCAIKGDSRTSLEAEVCGQPIEFCYFGINNRNAFSSKKKEKEKTAEAWKSGHID